MNTYMKIKRNSSQGKEKRKMAIQTCYCTFLLSFVLVLLLGSSINVIAQDNATLNRSSFPAGFLFGGASSAYQYEGAASEGGRGPSIWDTFTHRYPYKIDDRSNGDVAVDSYHRYKEDIGILKGIGFDVYRFSISWSRILPKGKLSGGVNEEGVNYYNNVINEVLAKGVQPFVTLFHWDLPQALEDEYGGFRRSQIVDDFRDYAELCFKIFGDRVKYWITLNEPSNLCITGYALGMQAPGRCSAWQNRNCTAGDAGTEPYIVAHNQILAHAAAVNLYRQKYQANQKGKIGITLVSNWYVPMSNNSQDIDAAKRAVDFMFGWFMEPLTYGDYPHSMRSYVGERLPKFTEKQAEMVKGSMDFLGLNYYTSNYATIRVEDPSNPFKPNYLTDARVNSTTTRNGIPIGPRGASRWLYIYPEGFQNLLVHIKKNYNNPLIYITENGIDDENNATLSLKEALSDHLRIQYHYSHLSFLRKAIIEDGVNVQGYIMWSLLDNFEWPAGYTKRFGLTFIDYKDGLKRYPKLSAQWFKDFLKK